MCFHMCLHTKVMQVTTFAYSDATPYLAQPQKYQKHQCFNTPANPYTLSHIPSQYASIPNMHIRRMLFATMHTCMYVLSWLQNNAFWAILRHLGVQKAPGRLPGNIQEARRRTEEPSTRHPGGQGHLGDRMCVFTCTCTQK